MTESKTKKRELVEIAGRFYPHELFLCAVNTVGMERIEQAAPEGVTLRQLGRNFTALKTPAAAAQVRAEALKRVYLSGPGESAPGPDDVVVAHFRPAGLPAKSAPTPLENRTDPGNVPGSENGRTP